MFAAINSCVCLLFTTTILQVAALVIAAESPPTKAPAISPAEAEFVTLVDSFYAELNPFWEHTRSISDPDELESYYEAHDPAKTYMPKLLEFERAHAGDDVGLDALAETVIYAGRGGGPEAPGYLARREAIQRLPQYEDRELMAAAIDSLSSGDYDPQVVEYLRRVAKSPTAHATVRAVAAYTLADELLSHSGARRQMQARLDAFAEGVSPTREGEADEYREYLATLKRPMPPATKRSPCSTIWQVPQSRSIAPRFA